MDVRHAKKGALVLTVLPLMAFMGGCSMDEVELNGGIFNAVGLGGNNKSKPAEPKMAARAPIVIPPTLDRIPEPGAPPEAVANDVAALDDPDKKAQTTQADLERQQAEYCKKNYEDAKVRDPTAADLATGPLGPCRGSVLTAIKKWNNSAE